MSKIVIILFLFVLIIIGTSQRFPENKWSETLSEEYNDVNDDDDNKAPNLVSTDGCYQDRDKCNDTILSGEKKNNLTNYSDYTALHCDCDFTFYDCLSNVIDLLDSVKANKVGFNYFNFDRRKCFNFSYPAECVKDSGFPRYRCLHYEIDDTQPKVWQWFDLPFYTKLIFN